MLDAVIVGAGGAGLSAALSLKKYTGSFIVITAGNIGHSNTARAHGGMQLPMLPEDSPELHFQDTYRGGNYKGIKELIHILTQNTGELLHWLKTLGLEFDRHNESYIVKKCEGISVPRVLSVRGYIGSAIIKVLFAEAKRNTVQIERYSILKAISRRRDGFVLSILSQKGLIELQTKRVILCSGGTSKQYADSHGYGTTNQSMSDIQFYESLKDIGITMMYEDSFQWHPTCISLEGALYGYPVPETLRMLGAELYDGKGERIHTDGLKRDELTEKMLNAYKKRKSVKGGDLDRENFFLDLRPALKSNKDVLDTFLFFFKKLHNYGIDPNSDYIPVCPMVHYQNGGIEINTVCETSVPGIYAAGEITGGIHGTNRLMGNSLLDVLTFGTIAGDTCGKSIETGG